MKRYILASLLLLLAVAGRAQGGMYGAEAALGIGTAYRPKLTPAVRGYYLARLTRSVYAGGALIMERYSFDYDPGAAAGNQYYGEAVSISHKSTYLFFAPTVDIGIGYRKYVHLHGSIGGGVFAGGRQYTYYYESRFGAGGLFGADTARANTSGNIPTFLLRYGLGLSERIPTGGHWNVMLTQEASLLPGKISKNTPGLQTSYISFGVGIMHKYPLVRRED